MRKRLVTALLAAALLSAPAIAQEMRVFVHNAGTATIPVAPQRIVALHESGVAIPLIELGVMPVGSVGIVAADGSHVLRGGMSLVKTDFANSTIQFVDADDPESIAALTPDLIITYTDENLSQLSLIAPTVVLDRAANPGLSHLRLIADAVGALPRYEILERRFLAQVEALRALLPDAADMTVSLIQAEQGKVDAWYFPDRGALGLLLQEVGFRMPGLVADAGASVTISAERLRELDADFIIATYRGDRGQTPADVRAAMAEVMPQWCGFLRACGNRQVIAVPRDESLAMSFNALDLMVMLLQTNIAGREFVRYEN